MQQLFQQTYQNRAIDTAQVIEELIALEPADGLPLEPREDDRARLGLRGVGGTLARHQVDEAPEDVEPGVAVPDVPPDAGGTSAPSLFLEAQE